MLLGSLADEFTADVSKQYRSGPNKRYWAKNKNQGMYTLV